MKFSLYGDSAASAFILVLIVRISLHKVMYLHDLSVTPIAVESAYNKDCVCICCGKCYSPHHSQQQLVRLRIQPSPDHLSILHSL